MFRVAVKTPYLEKSKTLQDYHEALACNVGASVEVLLRTVLSQIIPGTPLCPVEIRFERKDDCILALLSTDYQEENCVPPLYEVHLHPLQTGAILAED